MRIGVLSDTHIPITAKTLPPMVFGHLKTCDLILHAGDIVELSFLRELELIAPTQAVCGNMDSPELRSKLPEKLVIEAAGKKIGIVHGSGPANRIVHSVAKIFDKKVDVVVFGHSHTPLNEKHGDILFFNPGSPTDKVFSPYRSYGIIEISEYGEVKAEIIKVED